MAIALYVARLIYPCQTTCVLKSRLSHTERNKAGSRARGNTTTPRGRSGGLNIWRAWANGIRLFYVAHNVVRI